MAGYGLASYTLAMATILYLIGFVGGWVVPKGIDDGTARPVWIALTVNAVLVLLFAVQHEIMARPRFKAAISRLIPKAAERSTFVLLSSLILVLMFWLWQPIPQVLWSFTGSAAWGVYAVAAVGWVVVFGSTFIINHFDLFGVRQVAIFAAGKEFTPVGFKLRWFYKLCRHPLMLGFIIAFWAAPTMTVGHLWFAALMTLFIIVGIRFEEKDLVTAHGDDYREYQKQVRSLVPLPKKSPRLAVVGVGGAV